MSVYLDSHINSFIKTKVWVACHPEDFEKYFDAIYKAVNSCHECYFYQKGKNNETISGEEKNTFVKNCDLMIFAVTKKSLEGNYRNEDVDYALDNKIPVLPIDMESDISKQIDLSKKFNLKYRSLHMLRYNSAEFVDQLKNTLTNILVDEKTKERIQAAFAAYVFLSYRKVDKESVKKLWDAFKNIPGCWDISLWFDNYLVAGEHFEEALENYIKRSSIFGLLVTPHILETPNYVLDHEYPAACSKEKIDIVPVEMIPTDKDDLYKKFEKLPDCLQFEDETFQKNIWEIISKYKDKENEDPAHEYLIGLANLYGIDTNRRKDAGYAYIVSAAEKGCDEAVFRVLDLIDAGVSELGRMASEANMNAWRMKKLLKLKEQYNSDSNKLSVLKEMCDFVLRSIYTDNEKECTILESVLIEVSEVYEEFYLELAETYRRHSFDYTDDESKYFELYKKRAAVLEKLEKQTNPAMYSAVYDEKGSIILFFEFKDILGELDETYDILCQLSEIVSPEEVEKYRLAGLDVHKRLLELS